MSSFTYTCLPSFPEVSRNPSDILKLFSPESQSFQRQVQSVLGAKRNYLGCDLEFSGSDKQEEKPTILGVSDGVLSISVPWGDGLPYFKKMVDRWNPVFVGHFFLTADAVVFRNVGVNIDLLDIQDTVVWHYLTSSHLCKGTKTSDGDSERRGVGYMNLWAFCSLYTSLPMWKDCIGEANGCDGTRPCPEHNVWLYNACDALSCLLALPNVVKTARLRRVDHLYDQHRELMHVLSEMSRYGIQVDVDYVQKLREELKQDKERIAVTLPFSPTSPKQILEYFKGKGIVLESTEEMVIREAVEEYDDPELTTLLDFKELGNGPDRWFGPKFLDSSNRIHPRIQIFTSSSRLMCADPNLQNCGHWRVDRKTCVCSHKKVEHSGSGICLLCECKRFKELNIGGKARRAVVASHGTYLVKFDLKNGEGRVVFHFAGYEVPEDAHTWVAGKIGLTDEMEYCQREGGVRQGGKKISHSQAYLEGLQLKSPAELKAGNTLKEIRFGARVVYPGWTFEGKVVTFTGANFSERVWGDKSWATRRKAHELIEGMYFKNFPEVRAWQQRVTTACERDKAVRTPLGYCLLSYGESDKRCKSACAVHGSQPVAEITKRALIRAWRAFEAGRPMRPILQEHDSILYEVRDDIPPDQAGKWMQEDSDIEMKEIPGLKIPVDMEVCLAKTGEPSNWKDSEKLVIA